MPHTIISQVGAVGDSDDEFVEHEVVVTTPSIDGVMVHVGDSSGARWPYSQTLAALTWEEAENLHAVLGRALDEARALKMKGVPSE